MTIPEFRAEAEKWLNTLGYRLVEEQASGESLVFKRGEPAPIYELGQKSGFNTLNS